MGLLGSMIDFSHNAAATALWHEVGSGPALSRFNNQIGMTDTTPTSNDIWWLSTTTAADQITLMRMLAFHNDVLTDDLRNLGLSFMENVTPSQSWGISAGPRNGATVALKNGWSTLGGHGWQVNSIGYVTGGGRRYVIAVLTTDNPSMAYGIGTIEGLSQLVWSTPAGG
jgi:hypothetical protein